MRLSRWGVALRPARCRFLPPGPRDRRSARGGSLPAPAVPRSSGAAGALRGAGGAGCLGHLRPQHVTSCCPHHSLRTPAVRGHHRKELRHWPGVLHANLKHCPARDGARSHRFRAQPHETVPTSHSQPRPSPVLLADWPKSGGSHDPPSSGPIHRPDRRTQSAETRPSLGPWVSVKGDDSGTAAGRGAGASVGTGCGAPLPPRRTPPPHPHPLAQQGSQPALGFMAASLCQHNW